MKTLNIYTNQIGIAYKNGDILKVYTQGKYFIPLFRKVVVYDMSMAFYPNIEINIALQHDELRSLLHVVDINDQQAGLLYVNGLFKQVLSTGTHLYFKGVNECSCQIIDTSNYQNTDNIDSYLLTRNEMQSLLRIYTIEVHEKGLLFADGELIKVLDAGRYYYFNNATVLHVLKTDMRQMNLELNGQEILTKDKAQLRMNFHVQYKVNDIVKALAEHKDFDKQLYVQVQLALREVVGRLTFDELMESKETISKDVLAMTQQNAHQLGVEIVTCGIKDIILSGELKEIMNQVLIAEKKAQANSITRREETAATRSLLNTAKLMEDNAMLLKLKEMEYVEKIAEKINTISLSGNGQVVDQLKTIFVKQ